MPFPFNTSIDKQVLENFDHIEWMTTMILRGSVAPEGEVTAEPGSLYIWLEGTAGSNIFYKESGSGNLGWVELGPSVTAIGPVLLTGPWPTGVPDADDGYAFTVDRPGSYLFLWGLGSFAGAAGASDFGGYVDGNLESTISFYWNVTSQHLYCGVMPFIKTGLTAGTHHFYPRATSGANYQGDSSDQGFLMGVRVA